MPDGLFTDELGNVLDASGRVVVPGNIMGRAFGFHPTGVQETVEVVDTPAGEFPMDPAVYEPRGEPGPLVETTLPVGPTTDAPVEQAPVQEGPFQLRTTGIFGPPAGELQLETPELGAGLPQAGDSLGFGGSGALQPPEQVPAEVLAREERAIDLALATDPVGVEVPLAESQARREDHQRSAIGAGVDIADREGAVIQEAAGEAGKEIGRSTDVARQLVEDDIRLRKEARGEIARIGKKIEAAGIDPNRSWAKASTWNKVSIALGMFLGGMSAVFSKTGRNPAMEIFNRMIEQDLAAQKANLANLREAHSSRVTELGLIRQETGDRLAQENLFRANKLEQIQLKLKKDMAGLKGDQARQRADALFAELETQKQAYLEGAFKRTMARKTFELATLRAASAAAKKGGRGGPKKPKGDEGLKQVLRPTSGVFVNLETGETLGDEKNPQSLPIDQLAVQHRGEIRSKMTAAQDLANAIATVSWIGANRNLIRDADKATATMLMNRVKLAMQSYVKGIPSDKDMEMVDKAMGSITDPQKFFELLNEAERKSVMQASVAATEDGLNVVLGSYGYKLQGFRGRRIPMPGGKEDQPRDASTLTKRGSALVGNEEANKVTNQGLTPGEADIEQGTTGAALTQQREMGQDDPEVVRVEKFDTKLTESIARSLDTQGVSPPQRRARANAALGLISQRLGIIRNTKNDPRKSQAEKTKLRLEEKKLKDLRTKAKALIKNAEKNPLKFNMNTMRWE